MNQFLRRILYPHGVFTRSAARGLRALLRRGATAGAVGALVIASAARAEDAAQRPLLASAHAGATLQAAPAAQAKPRRRHRHSAHCGCAKVGRAWLQAHPGAAPASPASLAATSAAAAQLKAAPPAGAALASARATSAASFAGLADRLTPVSAARAAAPGSPGAPPGRATAPRDDESGQPGAAFRADSVYRLNPAIDGVVIAVGAAGSVLPFLFQDRLIRPRGLGDPATLNALDRSVVGNSSAGMAMASNVTTLAAVALPVAIDLADVGFSGTLFEDGVVMTEVLSTTGFGVSYAKYTTQRRSPQLYLAGNAGAAGNTSLYRSFVSWQTATTFASLSALSYTLSARHDWNVLPWVGTLLVGGSVAAERVASGGAFYTDAIAGAVLGAAVGTIIPWLHERSGYDLSVGQPPQGGLSIAGTRRF